MNSNFPASLKFCKMQGCGNDFILLNGFSQKLPTEGALMGLLAQQICHRRFGVGADGVLALYPASQPDCDFEMRLFQPDRSEAEMCGNGIRCAAVFAIEQGIVPTDKRDLAVQTLAGRILPSVSPDLQQVRVNMGLPRLAPSAIPCNLPAGPDDRLLDQPLEVNGREFKFCAVSMGNPHAVIFMNSPVQTAEVEQFGPLLETHNCFPARANIEFVQMQDEHNLAAQIWERGVGPTLACGTGACACAVAAVLTGRGQSPLNIHLPGGALQIDWAGEGQPVYMTGPAQVVYNGQIELAQILKEAAL